MAPGLGGGVVWLAELSALPVHRGDVHDPPPAALEHAVYHLLGDVEERVKIGLDHRVPGLVGHLLERAVASDAGVVHENVYRPDLGARRLEGALGRIPVRNVALGGVHVTTRSPHLAKPAVLA